MAAITTEERRLSREIRESRQERLGQNGYLGSWIGRHTLAYFPLHLMALGLRPTEYISGNKAPFFNVEWRWDEDGRGAFFNGVTSFINWGADKAYHGNNRDVQWDIVYKPFGADGGIQPLVQKASNENCSGSGDVVSIAHLASPDAGARVCVRDAAGGTFIVSSTDQLPQSRVHHLRVIYARRAIFGAPFDKLLLARDFSVANIGETSTDNVKLNNSNTQSLFFGQGETTTGQKSFNGIIYEVMISNIIELPPALLTPNEQFVKDVSRRRRSR